MNHLVLNNHGMSESVQGAPNLRDQIVVKIQYLLENFPIYPDRIDSIGLIVGKNGELDPGGVLRSLSGEYHGRLLGALETRLLESGSHLGSYPPAILLGPSGLPVGKLYISRYSYTLSLQLGLTFVPITIAKHPRDEYGVDYRNRIFLCPDEEDDDLAGNIGRGVVQSRQPGGILYFHCIATQEDINHLNKLSREYQTNPSSRQEYNLICERLIKGFYK